MSWQQKLETYKTDRNAAQQEIIRAKNVYQQEAKNWTGQGQFAQSDRARQISKWADQVRSVGQLDSNKFGSQVTNQQANTNYAQMMQQQQAPQQPQQPKAQPKAPQIQPRQSNFNPNDHVDPSSYKTQLSSVQDFMDKYGIDYSKDYAQNIADQKLQSELASIESARRGVNQNFEGGANSLDNNFFQQYQGLQQEQANRGLNGGIAAGQDTQLALGRQMALGDLYNTKANAEYDLAQQEGLARTNAIMEAEQIHQERLQQAFQNIMAEGSFNQSENSRQMQAALQMAQMLQEQDQFNTQIGFESDKFNMEHELDFDKFQFDQKQWSDQFGLEKDKFQFEQDSFNEEMDFARDKFNFEKEAVKFDQQMRTKEFNFMTEKEKTRAKEFMMSHKIEAGRLAEMIRSNKAGEKLNWAQLSEQIRSNKASEGIARSRAKAETGSGKVTNSDVAELLNNYQSKLKSGEMNYNDDTYYRIAAANKQDGKLTDEQYTNIIKQMNTIRWNNGAKKAFEESQTAKQRQENWSSLWNSAKSGVGSSISDTIGASRSAWGGVSGLWE